MRVSAETGCVLAGEQGSTRRRGAKRSPEQLSDLIGAIYDCVLSPENWEVTLESINRSFAFLMSAMGLLPLRAGTAVNNVVVGADQDWLDRMHDYNDDVSA